MCSDSQRTQARPSANSSGLSPAMRRVKIGDSKSGSSHSKRSAILGGPTRNSSSKAASGHLPATEKVWKPKWELYKPAKKRVKGSGVSPANASAQTTPLHQGEVRVSLDSAILPMAKRNPNSMAGAFYRAVKELNERAAPRARR